MRTAIQKATIVFPKLTTHKYWVGVYGGHYDIIVLFHKRPLNFEIDGVLNHTTEKYVSNIDLLLEQEAGNIAADLSLGDFKILFPAIDLSSILNKRGYPNAIEIPYNELIRVELTLPAEKDGSIYSLDFHQDW